MNDAIASGKAGENTELRYQQEVAKLIEDSSYLSSIHYRAASEWQERHLRLGISAALLSAVSGTAALISTELHVLVAAVLAFLASIMVAVLTFLDPSSRAAQHHTLGIQFSELADRARRVMELDLPSAPLPEIRSTIEELSRRRDSLIGAAPQVPHDTFLRARQGVDDLEPRYEMD